MKMENLRFTVRAKLAWTGIIMFLLFTSVSFYILKEQERKLRVFTQDKLITTLEETYLLQSRLMDITNVKNTLEIELNKKAQEIQMLVGELREEKIARSNVESRLVAVMKEDKDLKANFPKARKSVKLDKIVVRKEGKISKISRNNSFKVNLGSNDNLKKGDILSIYRDNKFIGKAEISKVKRKSATASILPDWHGVEFKKKDGVRIER